MFKMSLLRTKQEEQFWIKYHENDGVIRRNGRKHKETAFTLAVKSVTGGKSLRIRCNVMLRAYRDDNRQ